MTIQQAENKIDNTVETVLMTILILLLREDIILGQSSIGQINSGQGGGGRLVTLLVVTHSTKVTVPAATCPTPTPTSTSSSSSSTSSSSCSSSSSSSCWGHRILEDSAQSEREASVFMQKWFLSLCPIITRKKTQKTILNSSTILY